MWKVGKDGKSGFQINLESNGKKWHRGGKTSGKGRDLAGLEGLNHAWSCRMIPRSVPRLHPTISKMVAVRKPLKLKPSPEE